MNILYVITGLGGGGAEKVVVDLADRMEQKGHQVKIAYLKGEVVVRPKNTEIELIYIGLENLKSLKKSYSRYQLLIQEFKPDVVHAHMVHANIFARVTRKFSSIPKLICTAHSNHEGGRLRMLAYKVTHSLADLTTNVSQSASESFEKLGAVPKGGIKTIYNGINLKVFCNKPESYSEIRAKFNIQDNTPVMLAVGRLHEAKDYPNLIRAFSILKQQLQPCNLPRLFIAGEGDLRHTIEQMIFEAGLAEDIVLLGRCDDIPALMSATDLFVLSSSYEGFGLVVAEAMACETFVVATDCGGVKEVMRKSGILVPPNDSEKLAIALKYALEMGQSQIEKNNREALEIIQEHFDLDKIIDQWLEVYAGK